MKHIWHAIMMFHCFVTLPAALTFFIYSVGASILLLDPFLLLWGAGLFALGVLLMAILSIMSE